MTDPTDRIGEDPARFLDADLLDDPDARELCRSRIDGIRTVEVVRVWIGVEQGLAQRDDRPPRGKVIDWLQQREQQIKQSDTLGEPIEELPKRDAPSTESDPTWIYEDPRSGEIERTKTRTSAVSTTSSVPWTTTLEQILEERERDDQDDVQDDLDAAGSAADQAVATDGGAVEESDQEGDQQ